MPLLRNQIHKVLPHTAHSVKRSQISIHTSTGLKCSPDHGLSYTQCSIKNKIAKVKMTKTTEDIVWTISQNSAEVHTEQKVIHTPGMY